MLRRSDIQEIPLNLLVSHYLLSSFCYYQMDQSPMTDDAFDYLCKRLLENYDEVHHMHKHLADKESLIAGTCLLASFEYPLRVQIGASAYLRACEEGTVMPAIRQHNKTKASTRRIVRRAAAPVREEPVAPTVPRLVRRTRSAQATQPKPPERRPRVIRRSRG